MLREQIHFCWFGEKDIPKRFLNFIKGWQELHPKWKIEKWDLENLPKTDYLLNAIRLKRFASASNWARLWILQKYGGIYLDTDIEIIRPLDDLMEYPAFVGFEVKEFDWEGCVNNAVFRSERDHWFVGEMRNQLEREFDGSEGAHLSSPHLTTKILKKHGLKSYERTNVKGVEVFPAEYFYPFGWHEGFRVKKITPLTRTIHWYGRSWLARAERKQCLRSMIIERLNIICWEKLLRHLIH